MLGVGLDSRGYNDVRGVGLEAEAAERAEVREGRVPRPPRRGLHSFTFQLNLSAIYGIGGALRDCVARVEGVLGGVQGVSSVFVYQTRLKLSWKVNECKPLPPRELQRECLQGGGGLLQGPGHCSTSQLNFRRQPFSLT